MMQEIQAIQASAHLASTKETITHKIETANSTGISTSTSTEHGAGKQSYQDDSTKVTLSSRAENHKSLKEVQAEQEAQEKKKVENHEIDYSLAMSGIPQYGGRLVTIVKYPDGRTEMIDAFSGKKVTQQDLEQAQMAKKNSQLAQQQLESKPGVETLPDAMPGESQLTDMQ
ncbi:hypothetical protein ACQ3G7_20035 [Kosakonia oryzendophytica]|uniref:hypothetical protein n=1 Tax=Kosakonia oryzendophytica TaxID=1005665 RepID=UPI003D32CF87